MWKTVALGLHKLCANYPDGSNQRARPALGKFSCVSTGTCIPDDEKSLGGKPSISSLSVIRIIRRPPGSHPTPNNSTDFAIRRSITIQEAKERSHEVP